MRKFLLAILFLMAHLSIANAQSCDGGAVNSNAGTTFFICPGSTVTLSNNSSTPSANYAYLVTDVNGNILAIIEGNTLGADSEFLNNRRIYGISYQGSLFASIGMDIVNVSATTCYALSSNFLTNGAPLNLEVQVNCVNGDAQVYITPSGGAGGYILTDQNGNILTSIGNTNITELILIDQTGCTVSQAVDFSCPSVCENTNITVSAGYSCDGNQNALLNFSAQGGTSPYTFVNQFNDPVNLGDVLQEGLSYQIRAIDANGCTNVAPAFTVNCVPGSCEDIVFNPGYNCNTAGQAVLSLSASGGSGNYLFTNNGSQVQNGSIIANNQTLNLAVTDLDNNCTIPAPPINVSCEPTVNLNIDLTYYCFFGRAYVYYTPKPNVVVTGPQGGVVSSGDDFAANTVLNITYSQNGQVIQVNQITLNACDPCDGLFVSPTFSCNGNTATMGFAPVGGSGNYTLKDGSGNILYTGIQKAHGDTLTVVVTDNVTGCTYKTPLLQVNCNNLCSTYMAQIAYACIEGHPTLFTNSANDGTTFTDVEGTEYATGDILPNNEPLLLFASNNAGCTRAFQEFTPSCDLCGASDLSIAASYNCNPNGGVATLNVSASGGEGAYTFTDADGNVLTNGMALENGETLVVSVTDGNECTVTANAFTVSCNNVCESLSLSANYNCIGGVASLALNASGGAGGYIFTNQNDAIVTNGSVVSNGSVQTITVTDALGCSLTANSFTIDCIVPCSTLQVNAGYTCNNGAATLQVSATGGNGAYVFTDQNGNTFTNGQSLSDAQTVSVTVIDSEGCMVAAPPFTVDCQDPCEDFSLALNYECVNAIYGLLNINISGGEAPYYHNGQIIEANSQEQILIGITIDDFTVTDANGCSQTVSNLYIDCPDVCADLSLEADYLCLSGTATLLLSPSGGDGTYVYTNQNGNIVDTNTSLQHLQSYTITVTDGNGCTAVAPTFSVDCPDPCVSANLGISATYVCNSNGTALLIINGSGGDGNYTFTLDNGQEVQNGSIVSNGNYVITLTDGQACSVSTGTLNINCENDCASSNLQIATDYICNDNGTANVQISASGGTPPYIFTNQNGNIVQNGLLVNNNQIVTISVTDANSCVDVAPALFIDCEVIAPCDLSIAAGYVCVDEQGILNISAANGTPPYAFTDQNGNLLTNGQEIGNGTYTITATDANDCVATAPTFTIDCTVVNPCNISLNANYTCYNSEYAILDFTVNNGTPPYAFTDQNGNILTNQQAIANGSWVFTVTDANNCTANSATITLDCISLCDGLSGDVGYNCDDDGLATLFIDIIGGSAPYVVTDAVTDQSYTNGTGLVTGQTCTVVVQDANGCTINFTPFTVEECIISPCANISISFVSTYNCINEVATLVLEASGGTAPYMFTNQNGLSYESGEVVAHGVDFEFTVTDANGCTTVGQAFTVNCPTGLADIAAGNILLIPNPANNYIQISSEANGKYITQVTILDMYGRAVLQQTPPQSLSSELNISIADLPNAVYNVIIRTNDEGIFFSRLVKM